MSVIALQSNLFNDYIKAGNPETSADELRRMAESFSAFIRLRVAENVATPEDILSELADDPNPEVRIAVAVNPRTRASDCARIIADADVDVRMGIAADLAAPYFALKKLSEDDNPYVKVQAQRTMRHLPQEQIQTLSA
jgi:hypothetical protein